MKKLIYFLLLISANVNAQNFLLNETPPFSGDTMFIQYNGSGSLMPLVLDPDNFFDIRASRFLFGSEIFTDTSIGQWKQSFSWGNHADSSYLQFSDTNIIATRNFVLTEFVTANGLSSQYIAGDGTKANFPSIPSNTNQLTNGSGYLTSVTWSIITDKPTFFSGDYNDLVNRPTLFDGDYGSLTNKPNLFSGAYSDLTGKPSLFSGSYVDLTNKPKIPSTYSGTTNASGVYTVTFAQSYSVAPNIQANIVNQSSTNQFIRITSISTTGFTVNVFQRNSINLLGTDVLLFSTANVNGAAVDVLITEK